MFVLNFLNKSIKQLLNSVFAQYEELSSPQFPVINLSLRLRLITANFGLDNSSYRVLNLDQ
jgi:hypothetical protein